MKPMPDVFHDKKNKKDRECSRSFRVSMHRIRFYSTPSFQVSFQNMPLCPLFSPYASVTGVIQKNMSAV